MASTDYRCVCRPRCPTLADCHDPRPVPHVVPVVSCDECYCEPIPYTEIVTVQRASLCPQCAFQAAAEAVEPLLSASFSPLPESLRNAEEGLEVLEMLMARVEARVRNERRKRQETDISSLLEDRPSHSTVPPEEM